MMTPEKAIIESRPILWREIAKAVPGRTNKDCRRRWCNSLDNSVSKGRWSSIEDERLCHGVQQHGTNWARVASIVRTRNADQCAAHWSQTLNPAIDYSDWSDSEDSKLLHAVQEHGTVWSTIASKYFPNRTPLGLKNRYSALCRGPRSSGQSVLVSGDGSSTWDSSSNEDDEADGRRSETGNLLHSDLRENQFSSNTGFTTTMQGCSQGGLQSPARSYVESAPPFAPFEALLNCTPPITMNPSDIFFMHNRPENANHWGQHFLTPSSLEFGTPELSQMQNPGVQIATPTSSEISHDTEQETSISDQTQQQVSIDLVCKKDQLGHIMAILVDLTTSMVVRPGNRS